MKMKDLALAQVRRGERFTLDGVEFVKLEDDLDAAFAVAADTLPECCQFEDDDAEREDHNNYAGSLLSKTVERWLRDKHPAIFSAVVERPIDLTTMDGMTDYTGPFRVVSHGLKLTRTSEDSDVAALTAQVAELEAKLSHEQSEKESAQSALASLNEQLTTLKMTLEANSEEKAVVDEAPVEAMDAAGSV